MQELFFLEIAYSPPPSPRPALSSKNNGPSLIAHVDGTC